MTDMFYISTEIVFSAGHFIALPNGGFEAPHKHDWKVRVTIGREYLDQQDMVMDFHQLEKILRQAIYPCTQVEDINQLPAFQNRNPSTELFAHYIYHSVKALLPRDVLLTEVVVWETPTCRSIYRPESL